MDSTAAQLDIIRNLILYFIIVNIIGYGMMWYDKKCAQNGMWRVKEKTLLIISLIGGSIGSLIGMYQFRHKTKHAVFKFGIPIIIIIQIGLLIVIKFKLYTNIAIFLS